MKIECEFVGDRCNRGGRLVADDCTLVMEDVADNVGNVASFTQIL